MRQTVYDSRDKKPRFVVFSDAVVNQYTGQEVSYKSNWVPAYKKLYKQYKVDGL